MPGVAIRKRSISMRANHSKFDLRHPKALIVLWLLILKFEYIAKTIFLIVNKFINLIEFNKLTFTNQRL
jgi:hypothetical protein